MAAFIFQKLLEQGGPSGPNVDAAVNWFEDRTHCPECFTTSLSRNKPLSALFSV